MHDTGGWLFELNGTNGVQCLLACLPIARGYNTDTNTNTNDSINNNIKGAEYCRNFLSLSE
jgi:hypothetical protein